MKRPHVLDTEAQPPKRAKPNTEHNKQYEVEDIRFARQLKSSLSFRQDGIRELRSGLASLKALLEKILYGEDATASEEATTILKEYLESERPRHGEEIDHPFLSQLWQAWSFANSNNNDHLSSAVCASFALLLKTLSSSLNLRTYGTLLSRTILQHQHLRNIKRCLDAPKHKEFLLSPSLRLLIEVAGFDGGVNVRELYKHREQTFDVAALRKCLSLTKPHDPAEEDAWRRPAVRSLAVRYVLTHLKYQDEGGKIDILRQRPLVGALFGFCRADPPELLIELFRVTETNVLKDSELPRSTKAALLTEQQLSRVTEIATRNEAETPATLLAFTWLKTAISTPSYGILRPCGWYPPGTVSTGTPADIDPDEIDCGLADSESAGDLPLQNPILASWLKTLRPATNPKERELILACLQAAPELVYEYFSHNNLQMDPSLTNTWIGYASFMFDIIALPVPRNLGNIDHETNANQPPRLDRMLDSILPRPMTQKVLTRCLNQSSKLTSYFAMGLLVMALKKVKSINEQIQLVISRSTEDRSWPDFRQRLLVRLASVMPKMKDVVQVYRTLPDDSLHLLQRSTGAKALRLYQEVLPTASASEAFDISSAFLPLLSTEHNIHDQSHAWQSAELSDLLVVAQHNNTLKWYQRQSRMPLSPITSLLKRCSRADASTQMTSVAKSVLEDDSIFEPGPSGLQSAADALLFSLKELSSTSIVWQTLDEWLARAVKSPVKYLDDLDEIKVVTGSDGATLSLFVLVILEQASFVDKKPADEKEQIMKWILRFLAYLKEGTIEDSPLLDEVRRRLQKFEVRVQDDMPLDSAFTRAIDQPAEHVAAAAAPRSERLPFTKPTPEPEDHPELFRWQRKDLDLAFDDEDVDALIWCLSSEHLEVRKQASTQIEKLCIAVQKSSIEEKDQVYVVLGEVLETYRSAGEEKPLPYLMSTFAARAIHIQLDPIHLMYPKLNRFLMKNPAWRTSSMTGYWLSATALDTPTDDDGYWAEVLWTLDWLIDGTRTQSDFDMLRQAGSIERLMSIHGSTGPSQNQVRTRVLELIYRMAVVDAASLVTRAGVLSWLEMIKGGLPKRLRCLVKDSCDSARLEAWTGVELQVI